MYDAVADRDCPPSSRLLALRGRGQNQTAPNTAYGVSLTARPDRTFEFARTGAYGFYLANFLLARDQPFQLADIGANQGLYSLLARENPQCRKVVALEPIADSFALLQDNLARQLSDCPAQAINAALADHCRGGRMQIFPGHSGKASLLPAPGAAEEQVKTIDAAALGQALDPQTPVILKVDVEGFEPQVFQALQNRNWSAPLAAVFYEVNEAWVDPQALKARVAGLGFRHFLRVGDRSEYDVLALPEASGARAVEDGA